MTKVENVMSRYVIAMFLLLLIGAAVEEVAARSERGPEDAAVEAVK
jgi:hypothetical protein